MQLRANEGRLLHETRRLREVIHNVQRLAADRGISLPYDADSKVTSESPSTSHSVLSINRITSNGPRIHVQRAAGNESNALEHEKASLSGAHKGKRDGPSPTWPADHCNSDSATPEVLFGSSTDAPPAHMHNTSAKKAKRRYGVVGLDSTTVGMEFVLTLVSKTCKIPIFAWSNRLLVAKNSLEGPCLNHIKGDPTTPDNPTGHALTASAPLLCLSNIRQPSETSSPWEAPTAILERLLTLTSRLDLQDEVTPVEAWN